MFAPSPSASVALNPELFPPLSALAHRQEQLVERYLAPDHAVLVRVTDERLEIWRILAGGAVLPRVGGEDLLLLPPIVGIKDERHDARILEPLHRDLLRLVEGVIEVDRNPR